MSCKYNNCKHCGYKSECEIFKENVGLKEDFLKACKVKEQGFREAEQALERKDKQLTKAKEIIKSLLQSLYCWETDVEFDEIDNSRIEQAEQFLKEE